MNQQVVRQAIDEQSIDEYDSIWRHNRGCRELQSQQLILSLSFHDDEIFKLSVLRRAQVKFATPSPHE